MRPCRQTDPPAQALGRPLQQRRPVWIVVRERQPGISGQAQGHERGATGGQAQIESLFQHRPGIIEPAPQDLQDAQLHAGACAEPVTASWLGQVTRLT
jgi:hypothetical protein